MSKIFSALKRLAGSSILEDDKSVRRRIRQLEAENEELREKLAYRRPWMF
ncbi:hypothetical protein OZ411_37345 [Bradyrhizobium sp. Arg237L]|nr:hypothetical protein [Bradyrhizobium sp. Arg237L]MDI4238473.1 hypothetical protein [Bradyrhizobium sp. Arg237L]